MFLKRLQKLKDVKVRKGRFGVDKGPFVYLQKVMKSWKQIKRNLLRWKCKITLRLLKDTWHWRKGSFKSPKFFYEVEFNKPGGMMMILVEITYEDGTLKTSSIQLKSGEK
jgi:hypothetical protein